MRAASIYKAGKEYPERGYLGARKPPAFQSISLILRKKIMGVGKPRRFYRGFVLRLFTLLGRAFARLEQDSRLPDLRRTSTLWRKQDEFVNRNSAGPGSSIRARLKTLTSTTGCLGGGDFPAALFSQ